MIAGDGRRSIELLVPKNFPQIPDGELSFAIIGTPNRMKLSKGRESMSRDRISVVLHFTRSRISILQLLRESGRSEDCSPSLTP